MNGKRAKHLRRLAHKGNDISHRHRDLRAIERVKMVKVPYDQTKIDGDGNDVVQRYTTHQAVDVGPRGEYQKAKDEFKRLRRG